MIDKIEFTVFGKPATAGSKRGFPIRRKDGSIKIAMTHDNKRTPSWMAAVASMAREVYAGDLLSCPIQLEVDFYFARPKCHFGTGRKATVLSPSAPAEHTKKPDTTKCLRAIEDALKGVIWRDDSQVCIQRTAKHWTTESECAHVVIRPIKCERIPAPDPIATSPLFCNQPA